MKLHLIAYALAAALSSGFDNHPNREGDSIKQSDAHSAEKQLQEYADSVGRE